MTTAYLAEIDTNEGTRYLGKQSKLSRLPVFWHNRAAINRALNPQWSYSWKFNLKDHAEKTTIVQVDHLERGLRASSGKRMTLREFAELTVTQKPKYPRNARFRLKTPDGKFIGGGRFGKTWDTAGHLRSHLTSNMSYLGNSMYKGSTVIITVYQDDLVQVKEIISVPMMDFYLASPYSRKTFNDHKSSLTDFEIRRRNPDASAIKHGY